MMRLEWEPKVGPAAIISALGGVSVLIAVGVAWGSTTSKVDTAIAIATRAETSAKEAADAGGDHDRRIAAQAVQLGKIETSLTFIVPTLQRIETKLDTAAVKK